MRPWTLVILLFVTSSAFTQTKDSVPASSPSETRLLARMSEAPPSPSMSSSLRGEPKEIVLSSPAYISPSPVEPDAHPRFFDRRNLKIIGVNVLLQTQALISIQSNGANLNSRGRTLDPFEKHFESYGYGWGAVYRYGGGVGLPTLISYMFHTSEHHKLERWVPAAAMAHAEASAGYAMAGSKGSDNW